MAKPLKKERTFNYGKLLIAEEPRMYQYTVAKVLGIPKAIILQQIKYWLSHTSDKNRINVDRFGVNRKWIYKTAKDWEEEIPLDWTTIRDNLQEMEKDYVIFNDDPYKEIPYLYSEQFAKHYGNMQKYYALDERILWIYMSQWIPLKKPEYLHELQNAQNFLSVEKNKVPCNEYRVKDAERLVSIWKQCVNASKYILTAEEIEVIEYNAQKGKEMDDKREYAKTMREVDKQSNETAKSHNETLEEVTEAE